MGAESRNMTGSGGPSLSLSFPSPSFPLPVRHYEDATRPLGLNTKCAQATKAPSPPSPPFSSALSDSVSLRSPIALWFRTKHFFRGLSRYMLPCCYLAWKKIFHIFEQRSAELPIPGCENFVAVVAHHFCPASTCLY